MRLQRICCQSLSTASETLIKILCEFNESAQLKSFTKTDSLVKSLYLGPRWSMKYKNVNCVTNDLHSSCFQVAYYLC